MTQQEIEIAVISSISSKDKLLELHEKNVSTESFVVYPHVFKFYEDYTRQFPNTFPSKDLIESKFALELVTPKDGEYYVQELLRQELSRKAQLAIESAIISLVDEDKPEEAVGKLLEDLSKLRRGKRVNRSITDGEALKRLDKYLERKQSADKGLVYGMSTGLSFLDEDIAGLTPGNLVGIIGGTAQGKSWFLEFIAISMYQRNHAKVVFISPEMTNDQIERRWDTLLAKFYNLEFSNMGLIKGRNIDLEKYENFLRGVAKRNDWITYDSSDLGGMFSVPVIEDIVSREKPDVLAVDGLPLLGVEGSKQPQWERMMDITSGLKTLAKSHNIICVVTNQAVRGAEKNEDPTVSDVGYSLAFVQACDQAMMIMPPKDRTETTKRRIKLIKVREGIQDPRPIEIFWDVDRGCIKEVS